MARLWSRLILAALLVIPAASAAGQAQAPTGAASSASPIQAYRREVFAYQRAGRPDPFQPLLSAADMGYRVEDLRLTSIVYSPTAGQSVAVFALADSARRFRLRVGQRLGTITVAAIYPRRVDLRVEDFGVARIESVALQRLPAQSAAPAPSAAQPGQPIIVQQAPPRQSEQPSGPLRRGGARNNPAAPSGTTSNPAGTPRVNSRTPSYR
jgi:hypothetical protein